MHLALFNSTVKWLSKHLAGFSFGHFRGHKPHVLQSGVVTIQLYHKHDVQLQVHCHVAINRVLATSLRQNFNYG